jgi:hypothetical protein
MATRRKRSARPTRSLTWIPIIHSGPDLGSVGDALRQAYVQRTSPADWDQHIRTVDDAWARIRQTIDRLKLDYAAVRIYQDGLPQCDHELEIVRDLAALGSQNHQIVLDLVARGATLVGTESPALLLEEYELVRQSLLRLSKDESNHLAAEHRARGDRVLERRDRFIAGRVDETLRVGEQGLIFLGLLHALERFLPRDVLLARQQWWAAQAP